MQAALCSPRPVSLALDTGRLARRAFRAGDGRASTVGVAPGHVQANLIILPAADAAAFRLFCERNPKPCPILAVGAPGDWRLPTLGEDLDVRTDLAGYRVWRDGVPVEEPGTVAGLWRCDLVAFALGCSISFDDVLAAAGVRLRHLELGVNPPTYETNLLTAPAGRFGGAVIASMRPLSAEDAGRAAAVTATYPHAHGAPLHTGDPAAIGVDLAHPVGGTALPLQPGELPVFWACGVTPELAIRRARPDFCITHRPGAMLVTDVLNRDLAID